VSKIVLQLKDTQQINMNIYMLLSDAKHSSCSNCHVLEFQLVEITLKRKRNLYCKYHVKHYDLKRMMVPYV
jgi:hypothetical protein